MRRCGRHHQHVNVGPHAPHCVWFAAPFMGAGGWPCLGRSFAAAVGGTRPHRVDLLAQALQFGLHFVQIRRAVLSARGNDAAHRFDYLDFMGVEEAADGGVSFGHQRAFVEQGRDLRQRRKVDGHGRTTQGLQPRHGLREGRFGGTVPVKLQRRRHTKTEGRRKRFAGQCQTARIRIERVMRHRAFQHLHRGSHRARKDGHTVHALRGRHHTARADQPA